MLCVLILGAIAAQGAAAAGTTSLTCENVGSGVFTDAHCKTKGPGEYSHVFFSAFTPTTFVSTNVLTGAERSPWILKAIVVGLGVQLEAKKVSATGTLENKESGAEMWTEGSTETILFEEVTANLGCSVTGLPGGAGKVETVGVKGTTKGQGDSIKYEPKEGTKFAEFELNGAGCPAAVKGKYPVFGTITCVPNGATCVFTHNEITTAKTLRLKNATEGPVAGLSGTTTTQGTDPSNPSTGDWPLAATTFL